MTTMTQDTKMVPFNSIYIDEELNARTVYDAKKHEWLLANIKKNGVIEPLVCVNGGTGEKALRLHVGFRRARALKALKWGDKLVPVTVRESWDPLVTLAENSQREDLHPLDLAAQIWGLVNGDYNVPEGVERRAHTLDEIVQNTSVKSTTYARNMCRVHDKLSAGARKLALKHPRIPIRLLIEAVGYGKDVEVFKKVKDPETGEYSDVSDGKMWEPNETKQISLVSQWIERQVAADDTTKEKKTGGGDEGGDEGPRKKGQKDIEACIKILQAKSDDKDEGELHKARAQALRFALGEIDRLPGITVEELKEKKAELKAKAQKEKQA